MSTRFAVGTSSRTRSSVSIAGISTIDWSAITRATSPEPDAAAATAASAARPESTPMMR